MGERIKKVRRDILDYFYKIIVTKQEKRKNQKEGIKAILLYCTTTTMEEHIVEYYETTKKMSNMAFYLFYENEDYTKEERQQGALRVCAGRTIKNLRYFRFVKYFP